MAKPPIDYVRDGMLSVKEAMDFTGLGRAALDIAMNTGLLLYREAHPGFRKRLIPRSDLLEFLAGSLKTVRQKQVTAALLTKAERLEIVAEGAITPEEAARLSGYGRSKLWDCMDEATLPFLQPEGSDRRIPKVALLRLVAEHLAPPPCDVMIDQATCEIVQSLCARSGLSEIELVNEAVEKFSLAIEQDADVASHMMQAASEDKRTATKEDYVRWAVRHYEKCYRTP